MMGDPQWDGTTQESHLKDAAAAQRHAVADAARHGHWSQVIALIAAEPRLANVSRPGGTSLYAPLHQMAHAGAPPALAGQLIALGAWRSLQNAHGERPVDVADRRGHGHLVGILTPVWQHHVPAGVLLTIEANFHDVIRGRIDAALPDHGLRLPPLEPLLELDRPQMWFPVPGMYGGFSYRLEAAGESAALVCESWSRVVEGSGQRHVITSAGSKLIAEGFV